MSFPDTIVLFILALLLFGPKKLPEIARQVGKALNEFKRASNEFKAQIEAEISQLDLEEKQKERQKEEQKILPPAEPPAGAVVSSRYSAQPLTAPDPDALSPDAPSQDVNLPAHNPTNA